MRKVSILAAKTLLGQRIEPSLLYSRRGCALKLIFSGVEPLSCNGGQACNFSAQVVLVQLASIVLRKRLFVSEVGAGSAAVQLRLLFGSHAFVR